MEQDEKNLQLVAISDYDLDAVQTYYGSERSLHNPLSYIPPTTATTTSSESANSLSDHALMINRLHEEQQQQNQQQRNQNVQRDSNSPNTLSSQDILTNGTSSISWPSCYSILIACMAQEDEQRQAIALEENRTFYEVRENLRNKLAQLRNDYKWAHAEVGYEDTSDELSFGREVPVLRKVVVPPHPASTPLHDYKNGSPESNEMLSSLPKSSASLTNNNNNNNHVHNTITSSSSSSSTSALAKANKEFNKRRTSQSSELTSSSAQRRGTGVYIINSESLQHIHLPRNFDENVDAVLNSDSDNEHNNTTKQNEMKINEEEVELNSLRRSAPREIKARGALRSKQEMNAQHKLKRRSPINATSSTTSSSNNNNTPISDTSNDDVLTIHNDPCEAHSNTNANHKKEELKDDELNHDELNSHSQCIINVNDDDEDENNNEEDETLLTINTPTPRQVGAKVSNEKSNFAPLQLQNSHNNNNNNNHDDSNDDKDDANPTHTIHMVPLIYDNTDDESNDEIDINKNNNNSSPIKAMDHSINNNNNKNNANGMSSSKDENDTRAFHQQDQSTHSSDESFLSYTTTQHYHDEVQFFYKQESIRRQRLVNWEEEARDIIAQSALSDYFRTLAEEGNYSDESSDDDDVY